jgi:hypothetical protein
MLPRSMRWLETVTAVKVSKHHNIDPSARFPSAVYIDGDSRQSESDEDHVFRLPGESPESYIFRKVLDRIEEAAGKLAVALHLPFEAQEKVAEVVRNVNLTNRDPHLLFSQVGENLGLIAERIVRSAFLSLWAQLYPSEVSDIIEKIHELLPTEGGTGTPPPADELPVHAPSGSQAHTQEEGGRLDSADALPPRA